MLILQYKQGGEAGPERSLIVIRSAGHPEYTIGSDVTAWSNNWQTATGVTTGSTGFLTWGRNGTAFTSQGGDNQLFFTTNSGASWSNVTSAAHGFTQKPRGFWYDNKFYIGAGGGGNDLIIKTTTDFVTFTTIGSGNFNDSNSYSRFDYNTNSPQFMAAVGQDGFLRARIAHSSDYGVTWTQSNNFLSNNDYAQYFSYVNDAWFMSANGRGLFRCPTPSAGGTWTEVSTHQTVLSMTYGNGLYVAHRLNSPYILTSPDGITWSTPAQTNGPNGGQGDTLDFHPNTGTFMVADANHVKISTDAQTWTTISSDLYRILAATFVPTD